MNTVREKYELELSRPKEVSVTAFKNYIKEAVDNWHFGIDCSSLKDATFEVIDPKVKRIK